MNPQLAKQIIEFLKTSEKIWTLRSSIWQKRSGNWQMIFHQGTIIKGTDSETITVQAIGEKDRKL